MSAPACRRVVAVSTCRSVDDELSEGRNYNFERRSEPADRQAKAISLTLKPPSCGRRARARGRPGTPTSSARPLRLGEPGRGAPPPRRRRRGVADLGSRAPGGGAGNTGDRRRNVADPIRRACRRAEPHGRRRISAVPTPQLRAICTQDVGTASSATRTTGPTSGLRSSTSNFDDFLTRLPRRRRP